MEPTVFNVIILDKSGSMNAIRRQAVDGVNETLGGIRSSKQKKPELKQMVTLVAFCGCELRTIYDNIEIDEAHDITPEDYNPCCMTPLYDAIGNTITRLHKFTGDDKNAMVSVTIITDGYENASREFSGKAIKALIEAYKAEGWMFAYIGANHDVEAVAGDLSIDNSLCFEATGAGTKQMFACRLRSQERWEEAMTSRNFDEMTPEEVKAYKRGLSSNFFDEDSI